MTRVFNWLLCNNSTSFSSNYCCPSAADDFKRRLHCTDVLLCARLHCCRGPHSGYWATVTGAGSCFRLSCQPQPQWRLSSASLRHWPLSWLTSYASSFSKKSLLPCLMFQLEQPRQPRFIFRPSLCDVNDFLRMTILLAAGRRGTFELVWWPDCYYLIRLYVWVCCGRARETNSEADWPRPDSSMRSPDCKCETGAPSDSAPTSSMGGMSRLCASKASFSYGALICFRSCWLAQWQPRPTMRCLSVSCASSYDDSDCLRGWACSCCDFETLSSKAGACAVLLSMLCDYYYYLLRLILMLFDALRTGWSPEFVSGCAIGLLGAFIAMTTVADGTTSPCN